MDAVWASFWGILITGGLGCIGVLMSRWMHRREKIEEHLYDRVEDVATRVNSVEISCVRHKECDRRHLEDAKELRSVVGRVTAVETEQHGMEVEIAHIKRDLKD